jgi:hypothetical protein
VSVRVGAGVGEREKTMRTIKVNKPIGAIRLKITEAMDVLSKYWPNGEMPKADLLEFVVKQVPGATAGDVRAELKNMIDFGLYTHGAKWVRKPSAGAVKLSGKPCGSTKKKATKKAPKKKATKKAPKKKATKKAAKNGPRPTYIIELKSPLTKRWDVIAKVLGRNLAEAKKNTMADDGFKGTWAQWLKRIPNRQIRIKRETASMRKKAAKKTAKKAPSKAKKKARIVQPPAQRKSLARVQAGRKAASTRRDKDERAAQEIPEELHDVWEKVKGRITPIKGQRKAEAFIHWAETHPDKVNQIRAERGRSHERAIEHLQRHCSGAADAADRELTKKKFGTFAKISRSTREKLSECAKELGPDYEPDNVERNLRLARTGAPF